jgi:GxxExxY protein
MPADSSSNRAVLRQEEITREVIGAFFRVYNTLRHGYLESVYAGAMVVELRRRGILVQREAPVDVRYAGEVVGTYRADLIVEGEIVVELKSSAQLDPSAKAQLLNYLRATGLELGLLLHFGKKASFGRVIATRSQPRAGDDPR